MSTSPTAAGATTPEAADAARMLAPLLAVIEDIARRVTATLPDDTEADRMNETAPETSPPSAQANGRRMSGGRRAGGNR